MNYIDSFDVKRFQWRRYSVAVLTVAIALLMKLLLAPLIEQENPFLLFFAAVLVSARYGGIKAGILSIILSALGSDFFFIHPLYSFLNYNFGQNLGLFMFVAEGIAIASVVTSLMSAKRRTEVNRLKALQEQEILRQSEERFRLLVEGVREYAIFMLDINGRVISWNVGAERIFGYQEAEIINQHFSRFFTPEDIQSKRPEHEMQLAVVKGQADEEGWHIRKNGTSFWGTGVLVALRDEAGSLRGFSKVVRDITDRKQAAKALQKAKDELEISVENRMTELKNANQQLQNQIIERQRTEQALQESQTRLKLINSLSATVMMSSISVEQIIKRIVKQLSKHFQTLRVTYATIDSQGKLSVIYSLQPETMPQLEGLVVDLTAALEYLNTLRNNNPVIVEDITLDIRLASLASAMLNAGTQALINVPFEQSNKLLGLLCFESPLAQIWSKHEIATLVGITQYLSILVKNARAEQERIRAEEALRQAHDELEIRVKKRTAELAKANAELRTEIIERQRAEQEMRASEERLRIALKAAHMDTWDWNIPENQISYSHNHKLLFGLTSKSSEETYETFLECVHPQDIESVATAVIRSINDNVSYEQEFRIICPDGSIRWIVGKGQAFYDETGTKAVRMIGINMDITERKCAAEQIEASLKEKEVLLKEIHHRVKNNLQIISSLLNLQSAYVEDNKTLELLKAGENRVASMAMIHEQLYQSKDLAKIDFAGYIENLAANLLSSYNLDSNTIALRINVENVALDVDTAIPCGLIINELISNSLKYAFPKNKGGEIYINIQKDNDSLIIVVGDNGIGFPLEIDFQNTESLGLQIVNALTLQLEGTIELNRDFGTEFKIKLRSKSS